MKSYNRLYQISAWLFVLSLICVNVFSQDVLRAPAEHQSFAQRLDWARSTAKSNSSMLNGY